MPHDDDILLRADDLACWFDVSPPWLERTLSRQPAQTLKAVDGVTFSLRAASASPAAASRRWPSYWWAWWRRPAARCAMAAAARAARCIRK